MKTSKKAAQAAQLSIMWAPDAPAPAITPPPSAQAAETHPPIPPAGPDPIEAFLERCGFKGFSRHTVRSYRTDLSMARRACGNLLTATEAQVEAFLAAETQRGLHPGTVGRRLNTLRSFFKDARRHKLATDDPTVSLDAPKKPRRLPKYLRDHEVAQLLAALRSDTAWELREAAMVRVLYHTGMRLSEMVSLDVAHVSADTIRVFGKGSKERELPVPIALRTALDAWLAVHPAGEGPLFTSLGLEPGRLSPCQCRAIVKGAFKRAGLGGRGLTPHKLRHTFATQLLNKGLRIDIIQRLLGHAGIGTTQMYAHTEFSADLREKLDAYL